MTTSARRGTSPVPITPGPRPTVRTSAVAPISGNAESRPAGGGITPGVLKHALRATEQALASRVAIGADAVELTRTAHETAWKQLQERAPGASLRDRTDAAFAVASMSILRPEELGKLAVVDSGQTRVLAYMKAADKRLDPDRPFVAVDRTVGKGALDPRFADGSDNQVFHTAFFITAGYLSAGRPDKKAQTFLAAFVHETPLDPGVTSGKYAGMPSGGASQQDLRASVYGAMAGARLRELRDAGKGHLAGTILAGMMARSTACRGRPGDPGAQAPAGAFHADRRQPARPRCRGGGPLPDSRAPRPVPEGLRGAACRGSVVGWSRSPGWPATPLCVRPAPPRGSTGACHRGLIRAKAGFV